MIYIKTQLLHELATLPSTWSNHAVGLNLHALIPADSTGRGTTAILPPRFTQKIRTGIAVEPPEGYFLIVCSRGSLAARSIFVTNSPGIVDPDYRGELYVLLYNGGHDTQYIKHGDRIAQLIVLPAISAQMILAGPLSESLRGDQEFGSTGG